MSANIILVHDDPRFIEEAAAALRTAAHDVSTFQDPLDALNAIEAAPRFEILVTRVQFAPGRPNGLALSNMARMKLRGIKVPFTVAPPKRRIYRGEGEFVVAPIDIPELVAAVGRLAESS
jgi:DNA-binding NtrC family response regulator